MVYELYLAGVLVHTSSAHTTTPTHTFHPSGYNGLVDEVLFTAPVNIYAMDDFTYANPVVAGPELIRGDVNNDSAVNIADAIYLLGVLFPGATPPGPILCEDAADTNNDAGINIADAIALLGSLFGSPASPLPAPNTTTGCGEDDNADLGCDTFDAC